MARVFYSYGQNMQVEGNNFSTSSISNKIVYKITAAWFLFVFLCFSFFRNNYNVSVTKAYNSELQRKFVGKGNEFAFNDSIQSKSDEILQKQHSGNFSFSREKNAKLRLVDAVVFIGKR